MITKKCEVCGKEFKTYPSQDCRFCSTKCQNKWQSKYHFGENNPQWNGGKIEKVCPNCGDKFKIKRAADKKYNNNFCSRSCYHKWLDKKVEIECKTCGKLFKVKKGRKDKAKFCSKECEGLAKRGKNSPFWKEHSGGERYYGPNWVEQRKKAMERDNFECQLCGEVDKLVVHHKNPVRDFEPNNVIKKANRLENLITLCRSCHQKIERWLDYGNRDKLSQISKKIFEPKIKV